MLGLEFQKVRTSSSSPSIGQFEARQLNIYFHKRVELKEEFRIIAKVFRPEEVPVVDFTFSTAKDVCVELISDVEDIELEMLKSW